MQMRDREGKMAGFVPGSEMAGPLNGQICVALSSKSGPPKMLNGLNELNGIKTGSKLPQISTM